MNPASTSPSHVYEAITQVTRAFSKAGIRKRHAAPGQDYQYRSIDDLLGRLGPLLARYRLCVLPRVLRRECGDRAAQGGALLVSVRLLVAFDLVSSRDGSRHVVTAWGEALDQGDKGTAKAMSSAYKGAMLQLFCVPTGSEDADATVTRLQVERTTEPVEGWLAWTDSIADMIASCETLEAMSVVRTRYAAFLKALGREQPVLFAKIGECFSARQALVNGRGKARIARRGNQDACAKSVSKPAVTADDAAFVPITEMVDAA